MNVKDQKAEQRTDTDVHFREMHKIYILSLRRHSHGSQGAHLSCSPSKALALDFWHYTPCA